MKTFDIGVDLDGVGYNLQASLAPYARKNGYPRATEERWNQTNPGTNKHGGFSAWGIPDYKTFHDLCINAAEDGCLYASGPPFPGFVSMMRSLNDDGHRLHIVTARTLDADSLIARATRSWLGEWVVPHRSLLFAKDKTQHRTDFFIEDSTFNYASLSESGMTVPYLISRPWNASFDASNRINDLATFVSEVRSAANPVSGQAPRGLQEMTFIEAQRA